MGCDDWNIFASELYVSNADEFMIEYWGGYLQTLLAGSLLIGLLMILVTVVLFPRKLYRFFVFFMSGISVMSYIQAMFLNGKLQILTGEEQTWPLGTRVVNLLIWILMISIVIAGCHYKESIGKICKAVCIYIMLIQVVSLGYLLITEELGDTEQCPSLTTKGALTLAENDNVLVFILDTFDSSGFDELAIDTKFVEPLSDFTYYRNATSRYGNTNEAIPYLLENTEYRYNEATNSMERHYDTDRTALLDIHQKGYNIGIYTLPEYLSDGLREVTVNYVEDAEYGCNYMDTINVMLKTSMYRTMPFVAKYKYSYFPLIFLK